jgi:uncharacterized protein Yka (UPF0111/DUF47 family)
MLANIFGTSPVMPLEKHVGIAYKCVKELNEFFAAAVAQDWDRASEARDRVIQLEHDADDLKKEIRLKLPKSLFMPVPREDLLELLLVQDKMANRAKDVSGIVFGRRMVIPSSISNEFLEFDTDDRQAALRGSLFEVEKEYNPVDVMFLYQVIEMTGEIADMAERVGRRLELLLSH